MFKRELPVLLRFLIGPLLVAVALGINFAAAELIEGHSFYIFLAATLLTSLLSGRGAGLLTSLLASLVHNYYFQYPLHSLAVHSAADFWQLGLFLVISLTVSWLGGSLRVAYAEATEARIEAEKASQAREDMIGIVSHDLRNPLSAIRMGAELIVKVTSESKVNELARKAALRIIHSSDQMGRLIQDLLDFEKIRSGRLDVLIKDENLSLLLANTMEMMGPIAERKLIKLVLEAPNNPIQIMCDRDRIVQVLSNLLGNAIKFTPSGGHIKLRAVSQVGEVQVCVEDNGAGIPAEQTSRIFDRYWQAEETARQGTGLGLSIAKGIVESHQGKIWVESTPGKGSCFYFTLKRS